MTLGLKLCLPSPHISTPESHGTRGLKNSFVKALRADIGGVLLALFPKSSLLSYASMISC